MKLINYKVILIGWILLFFTIQFGEDIAKCEFDCEFIFRVEKDGIHREDISSMFYVPGDSSFQAS